MTDVARDRAGRVVGVVVRDHLGATWTERAGLVVAADGRTSLVASQVGAPTVVAGSHAAAYVYGYWPAVDLDGYHWYYGDGLSAGVIPTNDGLACVFAAGPAAVLAARMRYSRPLDAARELLARLDCRLTDLTRGAPRGPVRFFRGLPARLRRPSGPGWALVGDAGWWKDPLSTYGITDAFRDAELLARAVVAGAGSDHAMRIALCRYQAERDRSGVADASDCRPARLSSVGLGTGPTAAPRARLCDGGRRGGHSGLRSRSWGGRDPPGLFGCRSRYQPLRQHGRPHRLTLLGREGVTFAVEQR